MQVTSFASRLQPQERKEYGGNVLMKNTGFVMVVKFCANRFSVRATVRIVNAGCGLMAVLLHSAQMLHMRRYSTPMVEVMFAHNVVRYTRARGGRGGGRGSSLTLSWMDLV